MIKKLSSGGTVMLRHQSTKGFTRVEALILAAILGILLAVIIPQLANAI